MQEDVPVKAWLLPRPPPLPRLGPLEIVSFGQRVFLLSLRLHSPELNAGKEQEPERQNEKFYSLSW